MGALEWLILIVVAAALIWNRVGDMFFRRCPACNRRSLSLNVNTVIVDDGPTSKFYRCRSCGSNFVQVDGLGPLVSQPADNSD